MKVIQRYYQNLVKIYIVTSVRAKKVLLKWSLVVMVGMFNLRNGGRISRHLQFREMASPDDLKGFVCLVFRMASASFCGNLTPSTKFDLSRYVVHYPLFAPSLITFRFRNVVADAVDIGAVVVDAVDVDVNDDTIDVDDDTIDVDDDTIIVGNAIDAVFVVGAVVVVVAVVSFALSFPVSTDKIPLPRQEEGIEMMLSQNVLQKTVY